MLEDIMARRKKAILAKWLESTVEVHPAGVNLLKNGDRFTNPVGYTFSSELEVLYDEILRDDMDSERAIEALFGIIRTRAVQDLTPEEAVGFVFRLKDIVQDELKGRFEEPGAISDFLQFRDRMDVIAGHAFNVYSSCREKVHAIRENEMRRDRDNAFRLLERSVLDQVELEEGTVSGYNGSEVTE